MTATYQLTLDELEPSFVEQLKQMHHKGRVKVTVEVEEEHDETAFLLRNPKNREILLKSIEQAERGNVIEVDVDELLKKL